MLLAQFSCARKRPAVRGGIIRKHLQGFVLEAGLTDALVPWIHADRNEAGQDCPELVNIQQRYALLRLQDQHHPEKDWPICRHLLRNAFDAVRRQF